MPPQVQLQPQRELPGKPELQASGQSSSAQQKDSAADPKQESTSKKKKGIRKLIPW